MPDSASISEIIDNMTRDGRSFADSEVKIFIVDADIAPIVALDLFNDLFNPIDFFDLVGPGAIDNVGAPDSSVVDIALAAVNYSLRLVDKTYTIVPERSEADLVIAAADLDTASATVASNPVVSQDYLLLDRGSFSGNINQLTYSTLIHEIGHFLGLEHPSDEGDPLAYEQDSLQFTIMHANAQNGETNSLSIGPGSFLLHDLASLESIYGGLTSFYNGGDTVYGVGGNSIDPSQTAENPAQLWTTIYDTGGIDTIDVSSTIFDQVVDLSPGSFSSIGDIAPTLSASNNLSIYFDTIIENVVSGAGNDIISGNNTDNEITPGAGNDFVDGAGGIDTVIFEGSASDWIIGENDDGSIFVDKRFQFAGSTDNNTLFDVEFLKFVDAITDSFGNPIVDGPVFPENGVSKTISLASAVGAFGATDGSEIAKLFLESLGTTVDNVTYTGSENAAFLVSEFKIPSTSIDYQGGIMLSSGGFPGPSNTSPGFTVDHFTPGDSDLDVVAQQAFPGAGQTQDASILEFRLFVDDPSQLSFDLVFGSDEYPEFANSSFVDVAAVFVNGENVALFPGSDAPLSITNENVLNSLADNRNGVFAVEWDGFAALGLTANLDAGWNDIKIGVADTGDTSLDTAIYLTDFELISRDQDDDVPTGEVRLKNVGGPLDNSLVASNTPEEHTFYEPSSPSEPNVPGSLSGTTSSFNNDVVTNFKSDDEIKLVQLQQIELLKQAVDLLQQLINLKKGSAIVEIDEDLDGTVDSVLTLEGDFENSRFEAEIAENDVVLTLDELNLVEGSGESDNLHGTDGADAIRSLGGRYDKIVGGDGADQFIFGAEANNGARERDVIMDYEVGIDAIVFEDGASAASVRETRGQVVIFLENDRDAIYVRGDGVTADNITIVADDVFQLI